MIHNINLLILVQYVVAYPALWTCWTSRIPPLAPWFLMVGTAWRVVALSAALCRCCGAGRSDAPGQKPSPYATSGGRAWARAVVKPSAAALVKALAKTQRCLNWNYKWYSCKVLKSLLNFYYQFYWMGNQSYLKTNYTSLYRKTLTFSLSFFNRCFDFRLSFGGRPTGRVGVIFSRIWPFNLWVLPPMTPRHFDLPHLQTCCWWEKTKLESVHTNLRHLQCQTTEHSIESTLLRSILELICLTEEDSDPWLGTLFNNTHSCP